MQCGQETGACEQRGGSIELGGLVMGRGGGGNTFVVVDGLEDPFGRVEEVAHLPDHHLEVQLRELEEPVVMSVSADDFRTQAVRITQARS